MPLIQLEGSNKRHLNTIDFLKVKQLADCVFKGCHCGFLKARAHGRVTLECHGQW